MVPPGGVGRHPPIERPTIRPDPHLWSRPAEEAHIPSADDRPDRSPGRPAYADISDESLLRRHVDGDSDAFGELVRRHRDRLWAVAIRTLGDPEEAADAVQDALLSALRAARSFRGDARVTTWLHRIVVNACLDRARRRQARPTVPLPDDDRAPAAPDMLGASERAAEVAAALATLPPDQAAALVLVDALGYPVDDAARILDTPVGTVKSRCARGRARLAVQLGHLDPGRNPGDAGPVTPTAVSPPIHVAGMTTPLPSSRQTGQADPEEVEPR
jgi:RNA polymerase sigma-70 factor, ECF subfamily